MPHDPYKALYIHVPYCASRCNYCDFHTRAIKRGSRELDRYTEHLVREIRRLSSEGELKDIQTVYFGGGTPTHIGARNLTQLLYALGISMHLTPEVECTVEANPESLESRLVADMWALGANRISIGVQSFDDGLLQALGRIHSADDARRAIDCAQTRFENVSIDLMCGLPGQTMEHFSASLAEAASWGVKHVSVYPLTIEKGTKFEREMRKERLQLPDDDLVADMMKLASERLQQAGMHRYEVANYAQPGFESRHNTAYWSGLPYLGIGESAVTMTQNAERRMRVQDGAVIDDLTPAEMAAEDLMLAMRMSAGVSDAHYERAKGLLPRIGETMRSLEQKGLVIHRADAWRPTERGWLLGNELYAELLDLTD